MLELMPLWSAVVLGTGLGFGLGLWAGLRASAWLAGAGADAKLDETLARLERLNMAAEDLKAAMDRIDAAMANIADDIRRLAERIGTGMTPEEVEAVRVRLEGIATAAEGLASQTPEPGPA